MIIIDNPEAIAAYRRLVIKHALKLLAKGIKPNRAYTMTATLAVASQYTGKAYPKSRKGCLQAVEDL